jgi:hypothetical protein
LSLVRPVIELHLRDAGDLADLPQVQLNLVEVIGEVDGLEEVDLSADWHAVTVFLWVARKPLVERYSDRV